MDRLPGSRLEGKYRPEYAFKIYELAKSGMSKSAIAGALGVTPETLKNWLNKKESAAVAYREGRGHREASGAVVKSGDWLAYVYQQIPEDLKATYDEIMKLDLERNGLRRIEQLLADKGKSARQCLFLHAMVGSNFNASEAMRRLGLDSSELEAWAKDPRFQDLLDEIMVHKKNFFEAALVGLVARGDPSAVIFANKTINADRGYNPAKNVNVSGSVDHVHAVSRLEDLDLPVSVQRQLLAALRKQRDRSAQEALEETPPYRLISPPKKHKEE